MPASARFIDENGYLLVKGCPMSTYGIFDYSARQCGETEEENNGDPDRIVKVFRPESVVSDPQLIASLKLVPFIDEHDYLTGDTTAMDAAEEEPGMDPSEKGVDGVTTEEVFFEKDWLRGDLKIFSRRSMQAMKDGKRDLSLGYVCEFVYEPGEWKGQKYDYIQIKMRGNHIALVDTGRVPGARVLDGLVFDSLSFNVPSTHTNAKKESKMDEEQKAQLMAVLEALCNSTAKPAEAADPNAVPPVQDETNLEHNEHEREAGAEVGVDDVIRKLEETAARLRESAGATAEHDAAKTGDEDDTDKLETGDEDDADKDKKKTEGGDSVDGLTDDKSGGNEIEKDDKDGSDDVVKAAKGPGAGTPTFSGDSALRAFHADVAKRDRIVSAASPLIGDFKAKARTMTAGDAAIYAAGKMGVKVTRENAVRTMDSILFGVELGKKMAAKSAPAASQRTGDSASTRSSEIDAYLAPRA